MNRTGLLGAVLLILPGLVIFGAILIFSQGGLVVALCVLPWYCSPTFVWCFLKAYNRYYQEQLHFYEKRARFEIWRNQLSPDDLQR